MLLLLGLAGLYLRTQARDRDLRALPPPADEAAPAVAVLPFAVQDGALASWREGLVDLVSIDLTRRRWPPLGRQPNAARAVARAGDGRGHPGARDGAGRGGARRRPLRRGG